MNHRYSLETIHQLQNRKVCFDANVLIYIFWPTGSSYSRHWESKYSTILRKLLSQNIDLCVDYIALSEFVNRSHRMEYDKHLLTHNNLDKRTFKYKDFRRSTDGELAMEDIYEIIKTNILSRFITIGKNFSREDIESFLTVEQLDFGDKGILLTCQENDCILLTNDADYLNAEIDLLSVNPKLFTI
jgi:predicted nucleic acid-binding protein